MTFSVNLHTHTSRCHHAGGREKDYIETALSGGLKTLGFSDHAPYRFSGGHYSGFRMVWEDVGNYTDTLLALREEYKNRIDIKIGYEIEYYPKHFSETLSDLCALPLDYLILGQHYTENEYDGVYSGSPTEDEATLVSYVNAVTAAIDTGLFTYIAHPDLLNFVGDGAIYEKHYTRLIEHAKKNGIPLEINFLGLRTGRHYPSERFFSLCGQIGAPVCFGCDAHDACDAYDAASLAKAEKMVSRFGLTVTEAPALHPVRPL